jgi:glycosyltransferase involved in cell wall biosynthesis
MKKRFNRLCFVIATKDRPIKLRNMLKSLVQQTRKPDKVVVVDGGDKLPTKIGDECKNLNIKYIRVYPPSATRQRNMGIKSLDKNCDFIGILDDDIILEEKSVENIMEFWRKIDKDVGGAAFNLMNHTNLYAEKFKSLDITKKLGLYSKTGGKVLPSGFQSLIGRVKKNTFVDWLPSTAVIWRKKVFNNFLFDEWYKGYSYLEDLDFSYAVGKKYKLAVVADAGYYHYPAPSGRGSGYEFGVREVVNRFHFVRKHGELSIFKCFIGLKIRQIMSLWIFIKERKFYFLSRAFGNSVGFFKALFQNK